MTDEYIRNILSQIYDLYQYLTKMDDKPGDLDTIELQLEKLEGFTRVLCNKLQPLEATFEELKELRKRGNFFLSEYDFHGIIDAYRVYSEDTMRIKNVRSSVIEALEDSEFIYKVSDVMKNL